MGIVYKIGEFLNGKLTMETLLENNMIKNKDGVYLDVSNLERKYIKCHHDVLCVITATQQITGILNATLDGFTVAKIESLTDKSSAFLACGVDLTKLSIVQTIPLDNVEFLDYLKTQNLVYDTYSSSVHFCDLNKLPKLSGVLISTPDKVIWGFLGEDSRTLLISTPATCDGVVSYDVKLEELSILTVEPMNVDVIDKIFKASGYKYNSNTKQIEFAGSLENGQLCVFWDDDVSEAFVAAYRSVPASRIFNDEYIHCANVKCDDEYIYSANAMPFSTFDDFEKFRNGVK